jgi:hypothetical protein
MQKNLPIIIVGTCKKLKAFLAALLMLQVSLCCHGQVYETDKICGTDTVDYRSMNLKTMQPIHYKAFACTQAAKLGLRVNLGFSSFSYYGGTNHWLGKHNAGHFGVGIAHGKFNLGVSFALATVTPGSQLVFGGDTVTQSVQLNPVKSRYYAGYSIDLLRNFSIEPQFGLTRNSFFVINEKDLNKTFNIPKVDGLTAGATLNKYFRLKDFQFIAVFLSYNYSFSNYQNINTSLHSGYSEYSFGLSYKVFAKRKLFERIN